MAPFARASSLDRLMACAGGAVLGGEDLRSDRAREAADWGTLTHHWKATGEVIQVDEWTNHPHLFRRKLEKSGVKREVWWPEPFVHEKTFAFDVTTGQVNFYHGEKPDEWKRSRSDKYCTGTADGYDLLFDSVLWVDDLKTGRLVSLDDYTRQLSMYALAVSRFIGYTADINLTVTHWPRYPNHGQPARTGRVITQAELLVFEKQLSKLRDDILRGRDKMVLVSGDHCTWCPSRGVCPEFSEEGNRYG